MPELSACPTAQELQQLAAGHLPAPRARELAEHLRQCPRCRAADATFCETGHTQAPDDHTSPPLPPTVTLPRKAAIRHDFLAPPQGPGEIGRLGGYRILKVLGGGGMGIVFLAEDLRLKRLVALKTMRPNVAESSAERQRFFREAQAAAAVKHDHVATIYQVGEEKGVPFLAMELLEGESLEERLKRQGRLPVAEVLRIGREIAEGLAAAHARGLIHRDVKPANVWLEGPSGRVKLLDFGLARPAADDLHLTQTGMVVGTPAYMAPEQARGEVVDERCDLFSLGVVLYRLATGALPFKGKDTLSFFAALATQQPPPARRINAAVPPALSALIERLLAKERERRPASAREVAQALHDIAQTAPAAPPRCRRLVVAAALALLAGLAALIVVIIRDRQGREVARIEVPEGGSVEVKDGDSKKDPGQAKLPLADRARPFVLVRKDGKREEFKHVTGALAVLADGDAIEVHANGPLALPRIVVVNKTLILRAGQGYRPRLTAAVPPGTDAPWIVVDGGGLRLEGCDLQGPPGVLAFLFTGQRPGTGPWELRSCRFYGGGGGMAMLIHYTGPRLHIEDCLMIPAIWRTFVELGGDKTDLELTNNVLWGLAKSYIQVSQPGDFALRLHHNTFCGSGGPQAVILLPEPQKGSRPIQVEAAGNIFPASSWPLALPAGKKYPAAVLKESATWQGRSNIYSRPALGLGDDELAWKDLAGWNQFWGKPEEDSRLEWPLFRHQALERLPPAKALPIMQATAAALLQPLGEKAAGVGPDWKLLGPGEAYVRALRAARGDKALPPERLRPEAPPGGPFVLVRAGKEERGFIRLQEAFDSARSGDEIEIRTDGPFPGAGIVGADRELHLTVRAAPGYRPVLSSELRYDAPKGDLRLEGLTFEECHFTGHLRHLAVHNCAFHSTRAAWNMGYSVHDPGRPVEFRNCIANWQLGCTFPKGGTLAVENCLTQSLAPPGGGAVQLRRSLVWSPARFAPLFHLPPPKQRTAVQAEGTLFVSGGLLFLGADHGKWQGRHNVYSLLQYSRESFRLAAWQKEVGSDADAQEVPLALVDPALWQLLPGQPRTAAGRAYGADVSRVGR
jgi:hypothetical protein